MRKRSDLEYGLYKRNRTSLFLSFANENKIKAAYAPSIAHEKIDEKYNEQFTALVNRLDFLSVREETGARMLRKMTNKHVECTVDPTLLLDPEDYKDIMNDCRKQESRYIFLYSIEWNDEVASYSKTISKEYGLPVYYLINRDTMKPWKFFSGKDKNLYGIDPNSFLSYIFHAEYVVTNSFHATVFSVLFHKKFCCFGTKKSYSRMYDFLEAINLSDRIYEKMDCIDDEIDYKTADMLKMKYIQQSQNYIESITTHSA